MKRFLTMIFTLCALAFSLGAQSFVRLDIGEEALVRINPAAASAEAGGKAWAAGKYTVCSDELYAEDPLDISVGAVIPFKWGKIGVEAVHDAYSFFDRHDLSLTYSKGWKVGKSGILAVGGGVSLALDNVDYGRLVVPSREEGRVLYCLPDVNLGFEYTDRHIRTGIAVRNLFSSRSAQTASPRFFSAYFGYRFGLAAERLGLTPYVLAGYSEAIFASVGGRVDWDRKYEIGYSLDQQQARHVVNAACRVPLAADGLSLKVMGSWSCALFSDFQTFSVGFGVGF